jgi:hypothetical protein
VNDYATTGFEDDDKEAKSVLGAPMDERTLVAILRAEEVDASSYYTSELAKEQADALDRYFAKQYGDEVEGRSKVRTHDIEDTINWMLPDLMRVFMASDDLVSVESRSPQDEENTQEIADCIAHVFWNENDGASLLHDFAFDGLLQKIGVASVRWEDPQPEPPQELKGVTPEQVEQYLKDPEYKILEGEEDEDQPGTFELKVQRTPICGKVCIENVPPEEFRISRRARDIKSAMYHAREQEVFVTDLIREFPDKARELDPEYVGEVARTVEAESDPRTLARFQQESVSNNRESSNHDKRKKVRLYTEYVRIDYDNDGLVELRQIKRVNSTILENERVDKSEFVVWSPIRVAHKLVGRSIADTITDIQKIRTVVTRRTLDALDQSLMPRVAFDKTAMDPEDVDALIDAEVGGTIPVRGNPGDKLMPVVTPDLTASGYQTLEYWDQKSEQASGVTRHAQGLNPDAITKTASGIDMLQAAANDRIELVARWLAKGVEEMLQRVLDLLCAYQDQPKWVRIKGRPVQMDPRRWSDSLAVKVHVAMSAANRQTMLANLAMIAQKQEQIIMQAGMSNPLCGVKELAHTYSRMVETMGFRDTTKFFKDVSQVPPEQLAPPQQEDPKTVEVKAKAELEQAKLQLQAQSDQQRMLFEQQKTGAELMMKRDAAQLDAQLKQQAEEQRAMLEVRKQEMEAQIAMRRQDFEMQLARERQSFEMQLAERDAEHKRAMAEKHAELKSKAANTNLGGDGVRMGGEIG